MFGYSVSLSSNGTTFVAGAPGNDDVGILGNSGHVRVYKYNSTAVSYTQVGLTVNGESDRDEFGTSVSISADGTTFVAGAPYNDGNGDNSGHVRVYKHDSTVNRYVQAGMDIDVEAENEWFGWSLDISADGSTFIVGAILNGGVNSGLVRLYRNIGPAMVPTKAPVPVPTPVKIPTKVPTKAPTIQPIIFPTKVPTNNPTMAPTKSPTTTATKHLLAPWHHEQVIDYLSAEYSNLLPSASEQVVAFVGSTMSEWTLSFR